MDNNKLLHNQRKSRAQKEANDFQWYKDMADLLDRDLVGNGDYEKYGGKTLLEKMQRNYNIINNIYNPKEYQDICNQFGTDDSDIIDAQIGNKDILSSKIQVVLGLEMSRAFDYKILAVNPEATTRKEQEETNLLKNFVYSSITNPIRQELEMKYEEQLKGRELSEEEQQQFQQQLEEEFKALTPPEVKQYMKYEHQDPAEILMHRLLEYIKKYREVNEKFSKGAKHAAVVSREFYWVGEVNGEPDLRVVNPMRFSYRKSPDSEFVEDGESARYEFRMTPSEAVSFFQLDKDEIDKLLAGYDYGMPSNEHDTDRLFSFSEYDDQMHYTRDFAGTVKVVHTVWKALREFKYLYFLDEEGIEQVTIVDESYKLNPENGDIKIETEWIPETYETWKLNDCLYKRMQPVPGQFRDLEDLYASSKLPYFGGEYFADNSLPTSFVDRGIAWQHYYNIFWYRLEKLAASDKGKKVLLNINAIPDSSGIDIVKFQHFFENTPFGWFDPNEEGTGYNDVNTVAKVLDLSVASDMSKYIEILTFIKQECGEAMGISRQLEAQIGANEAVTNTQQTITQNSYILEPFFNYHNRIKKNVLEALVNCATVCYRNSNKKKLSYILDDLGVELLSIDNELLDASVYGLFINDTGKAQELKTTLQQLAHAAMQNGSIKLSDALVLFNEDSTTAAQKKLLQAEDEAQERLLQVEKEKGEQQKQILKIQEDNAQKAHEREKELIILKEEERRKTVIAGNAITGMSFNADVDTDNDGVNDFFEILKHGADAEIKKKELSLREKEINNKKEYDDKKLEIDKIAAKNKGKIAKK